MKHVSVIPTCYYRDNTTNSIHGDHIQETMKIGRLDVLKIAHVRAFSVYHYQPKESSFVPQFSSILALSPAPASATVTDNSARMEREDTYTNARSFDEKNDENNKTKHVKSSLLAGIGSGALSSFVCAPLDLVRTRMQVMGDLKETKPKKSVPSIQQATSSVRNGSSNPHKGILSNFRDILQVDGIRGCFRGLSATLMTVPFFWGLYFPLYEHLKDRFHSIYIQNQLNGYDSQMTQNDDFKIIQFEKPSEGVLLQQRPSQKYRRLKQQQEQVVPSVVHLTAAITAGALADCVCNPLFVIRTRMQTEALHYMEMPVHERKPHSIARTFSLLYKEGGIPIFWRGLTASLLGLVHVGIQFPIYERIKTEARMRSPTNEESPFDLLIASGLSKMIACVISYPHEVLRSRMMDYRGNGKSSDARGLVGTYKRIVRNEGFAALYTGLNVTLVRVVPNCCVTFMSYELILRYVKQNLF